MTDETADDRDANEPDGPAILPPFDTRRLHLVLLSIAALAALVLAGSLFLQARDAVPAPTQPPAAAAAHVTTLPATTTDGQHAEAVLAARQAAEAAIAATPAYQPFFTRLKALFPGDYDAILDRLATRGASGATGGPDLWITEAVHRLRTSHGVLAAKAEGPALTRVFDAQLAMMRALGGSDVHLCVDFLYGTPSPDFYKFAGDHRPLVADMALAGLDAIDDGRLKHVERPPPTDADFAQLESLLTGRGLAKPEVDAILDGKPATPPIEEGRMCAIGQTYLEALAALPEPARLRIYGLAVELMARS